MFRYKSLSLSLSLGTYRRILHRQTTIRATSALPTIQLSPSVSFPPSRSSHVSRLAFLSLQTDDAARNLAPFSGRPLVGL